MTQLEKLHFDDHDYRDAALITEKIAIEFAKFISNHKLDFQPAADSKFIGLDMKYYTAEQLFQEFLKTKQQ